MALALNISYLPMLHIKFNFTLGADNPHHLAGVLPTVAVTSADHVLRDHAVKRLAAVASLRRDNGQRDRAEGGGDLAHVGAGVAPARHSTHLALGDGGALPRQQGDGDVAVQKDGSLQLERQRTSRISEQLAWRERKELKGVQLEVGNPPLSA